MTGTQASLDNSSKLPHLAETLESAFMEIRPLWWKLAKEIASDPGAEFARAPTATAFGSDFGLMLAWSQIVQVHSANDLTILVVCDDPWIFRHLATLDHVVAGTKPALCFKQLMMFARGVLSRCKVSFKTIWAVLSLRSQRKVFNHNDAALLVYAHPQSNMNGYDAYFADLLSISPRLKRALHVDCSVQRANELAADGQTASLHAWGNPIFAFLLPRLRWRPRTQTSTSPFAWLIQRAATLENSGGGLAMACWQSHCQENWLKKVSPACVLWPWENLAWERALCRSAQRQTVKSIGYQHTVVGPHQLNYSTATNIDGLTSIPDLVVANGPMYAGQLKNWGVPEKQLIIGGAFRFSPAQVDLYQSDGPIFMALSGQLSMARKQIDVARLISESGHTVFVKEHPMYPIAFNETARMKRTTISLKDQTGLSAIIYSTGTTGLEGLLASVPVFRVIFDDRISIDILPPELEMPTVTQESILDTLAHIQNQPSLSWNRVFAPVDKTKWSEIIFAPADSDSTSNNTELTPQAAEQRS